MILQKLLFKISSLDYVLRKILLISLDLTFINISIFLAFLLNKQEILITTFFKYLFICSVFGLPIYYLTGQYKGLSRYLGSSELYKIIGRISFITFLFIIFIKIFSINLPPFGFFFLFWMILSFLTGAARFIGRDILLIINNNHNLKKKNIFIYGAGSAAVQLATSILYDGNLKILGFLDDNPKLWGRTLKGLKISSPEILKNKYKVDKILFAISSISKSKKKELLNNLQKFGIEILQTPSVKELTSGKIKINELKPVIVDDLLGRDVIIPKKNLLVHDIKNKNICITGAGGSIGSELCLQIMRLNPKKLILIELSEVSLFNIQKKLNDLFLDKKIIIKGILGNILDEKLVLKTFTENNIDIVFHAAAYKHVPLVQENPLSGLMNNIFSTYVVCSCAKKANIKKLLLISSDKAVRPTNIMGISKRISELIVQAFAKESKQILDKSSNTSFSMVRFGNVLNSSGSVVPLFHKQILEGGPVTLTHPNVMRYFMTIPEAAQLVIQASTLAEGGEVFLLDMGEPVNIKDLAIKMINLSGMTVKDENNIHGDIEIKITGLRPGEKLYEELLIDAKAIKTSHPLIYKANENFIDGKELWKKLKYLKEVIKDQKTELAIELASTLIPENEIKSIKK